MVVSESLKETRDDNCVDERYRAEKQGMLDIAQKWQLQLLDLSGFGPVSVCSCSLEVDWSDNHMRAGGNNAKVIPPAIVLT